MGTAGSRRAARRSGWIPAAWLLLGSAAAAAAGDGGGAQQLAQGIDRHYNALRSLQVLRRHGDAP